MSPDSSDITVATNNDTSNLQSVVYFGGKLWNQFINKYLSVNSGLVKADSDTTLGASTWTLGE